MKNQPAIKVYYLTIDPDYANQRIDNFLITKLKGVPKTRIYRILRKGEVRVNKKRVEASYRLQVGDHVRIPPVKVAERDSKETPSASLMNLLAERILFEDKNLLIINKPAGIPVHGGSRVKIGIVEALRCMYPKMPHLELAHRLDADTSGCLVLAKKRGILKELHELLRMGKMDKIYLALTKGHWQEKHLRVEANLEKNLLSGGERMVRVTKEGKPSLTIFHPLVSYKDAMLVEAHLYTGRTHQIRVHSAYRQHPIAGDEKYGDKEFNKKMREKGLKRLFLHAKSIAFVIPSLEQKVYIEAPLEPDLNNCLIHLAE